MWHISSKYKPEDDEVKYLKVLRQPKTIKYYVLKGVNYLKNKEEW